MATRKFTVGRDSDCDLVIAGKESHLVSRQHAKIIITSSKKFPMLVDTKSRNGTFILRNNKFHKITQCYMKGGDVFKFGSYKVSGQEIFNVLSIRIINKKNKNKNRKKPSFVTRIANHHHHQKVVVNPALPIPNQYTSLNKIIANLKNHPLLTSIISIFIAILLFLAFLNTDKFEVVMSLFS